MSQALQGRIALVTGAGKNIGRAIALTLARDGATVLVNGRSDRAAVESVVRRDRGGGRQGRGRDGRRLRSRRSRRKLAKQAEALGGVDILVSNAGLRRQTSFLDMSFEEWREIMSVALDGAFLLGKAFVPQMVAKGKGGAFVAMSGISTHVGTPNRCHVSASKSGLEGLMRALARRAGAAQDHLQRACRPAPSTPRAPRRRARAAQPGQSADPAEALRHGRRDRRHGAPAGRAGRHLHHRPDHPCERR